MVENYCLLLLRAHLLVEMIIDICMLANSKCSTIKSSTINVWFCEYWPKYVTSLVRRGVLIVIRLKAVYNSRAMTLGCHYIGNKLSADIRIEKLTNLLRINQIAVPLLLTLKSFRSIALTFFVNLPTFSCFRHTQDPHWLSITLSPLAFLIKQQSYFLQR